MQATLKTCYIYKLHLKRTYTTCRASSQITIHLL